jgi:anti-sigma-K factor RskA
MTREDRDRLAAEHVLGLLEGQERVTAEQLLDTDRAFQIAVTSWRERLAELDETAPTLPADEALWQRIESGLASQARPVRASDPTPVIVPNPRTAFNALWRSLQFWRIAGLAGAIATIVLAIGLITIAPWRSRQPVLVAVLLTDANRPAAVVDAFADGQAELIALEGISVPPGRALEIWTILDSTRGPISVGLIDRPRSVRLNLKNLPKLAPDQAFVISLEPASGSPTGRPTGPVLMQGKASTTR